jgi:hypothetical protein
MTELLILRGDDALMIYDVELTLGLYLLYRNIFDEMRM